MQKKIIFNATPKNYQKLKPYKKNYTFKMKLKKIKIMLIKLGILLNLHNQILQTAKQLNSNKRLNY